MNDGNPGSPGSHRLKLRTGGDYFADKDLPESDALPRPLRAALDQLDTEIRKLHQEAALAAWKLVITVTMFPFHSTPFLLGDLVSGALATIVGSLASNFHGVPRSTRDAHFVVELTPGSLLRLDSHLPSGLVLERQGAFEGVTGTIRHLVTLVGSPFVCELFDLTDDPHDRARFARRVSARVLAHDSFVASAEDMIITKLRWATSANRPKDREDVRNILAVQDPHLDWTYLARWTAKHGTTQLLAEIRASVPLA